MIYRFRIISSEVKEFIRDIDIRNNQNFYDFHRVLTENLHYDNSQLSSFFLSNKQWEKIIEIALFDISEGKSPDIRIMDKTKMNDLVNESKQRLLYVFDFFNERLLFIELMKILPESKDVTYPFISFSKGSPPPQILILENFFDDFDDE